MTDDQIGCGDNSCIFSVLRTSGGMGTNGGCRCFDPLESWLASEKRWNSEEIQKVRRDVVRLARALRQEKESRVKAQDENITLRVFIARGPGPCVYCGLTKEKMAECKSGFPGCGRMDDIMLVGGT